jgi:hypothetical protein
MRTLIALALGLLLVSCNQTGETTLYCDHVATDGVCEAASYPWSTAQRASFESICTASPVNGTVATSCPVTALLGRCVYRTTDGKTESLGFYQSGESGVGGTLTASNASGVCTATNSSASYSPVAR